MVKVRCARPIEAANLDTSVDGSVAGSGADTIVFQPGLAGGTIELAGTQLTISDDLTINGLGADQLTLRGKGDSYSAGRVVSIEALATVDIHGLTISHGAAVPNPGGGILNQGTLRITDNVLSDNVGLYGGAIANEGTLVIETSEITNGPALDGAGIWNTGNVEVTNSNFDSHESFGDGSAIWNEGHLEDANSNFNSNQSSDSGGAIWNNDVLMVSGSSFSENNADHVGIAGGGAIWNSGEASIAETEFLSNSGVGTINLATVIDTAQAENGGPTQTHALVAESPAIDAGDNSLAIDPDGTPIQYDQRGPGFARVSGLSVDVGAYEAPQSVEIVIKSRDDSTAATNLASNGVIAIAIFTTDDFDAATVDASSVDFAGASAGRSKMSMETTILT